jgi:uncharacterized lipoprotein YddW (UPF0748 family)
MKKSTIVILFLCMTFMGMAQPKWEVRAVWLTTIGGIDWPSTYAHDGMGIAKQQKQLTDMLDQLKAVGINTVLLQTRVRATTIYPSDIEPWDGCLSGKPGKSPGYDALQFAIDECHRRGMELHAWVVTIPVGKWNTYGCQQLRRRYGALIRKIGDEGYMNPESPTTASYIADICEEITKKYDVDGIHLDYIRYPETWRGAKREAYITNIVRTINRRVKFYKPWVKLSCSPIGKYDDLSRYRSNGWNARSRVAQDAQGWLRDGLMDQLYPMMYFAGNNFYPFAIDWKEQSFGRHVISGLGVYMLHPRERNWPMAEVQRQLNVVREIGMGHCYFRAKFLLDNVKGVYDYVRWHDRYPALIPPMTWAQSLAPTAPKALVVERRAEGDRLSWQEAEDRSDGPYLIYNIYASDSYPVDVTKAENLIATRYLWKNISIPKTQRQWYYAVTAQDRYGNEGPAIQEESTHSQDCNVSSMLPNDGRKLRVIVATDAKTLQIATLQGKTIKTCMNEQQIDISTLPEGIYQLKSVHKKGITHRLGFFVVRR